MGPAASSAGYGWRLTCSPRPHAPRLGSAESRRDSFVVVLRGGPALPPQRGGQGVAADLRQQSERETSAGSALPQRCPELVPTWVLSAAGGQDHFSSLSCTYLLLENLLPYMRDLTHGLPPVLIYDQSWTNWVFSSTFWSRTAHGRKITSSGFVQGRPIIRKGSFYLRSDTIGQSEDRTSCNLQSVILVRNPTDRPQRSQNTNMHRMLPKHEDNLMFYLQKLVF